MKFIASTSALLKQLQLVGSVVPSKAVIPILEFFCLEVEDGKLTIIGTDLEVGMRTTMEVEAKEDGKIAIPAKTLIEIIKTLPEQPITFTIDSETNSMELTSDTGRYSIAGDSVEDFPKFPQVEGGTAISIPSSLFAEAISVTQFAISADELRPAMSGLYCQLFPNEVRFVSTDGNKMVLYKRKDATSEKEDSVLLPKKILNVLKSALPNTDINLTVQYNRLNAVFTFGAVTIVCRLIDERFPEYQAAIPASSTSTLKLNRNELIGSLKRLVIFANKSTYQIKFKIVGSALFLTAEDLDFANKADERLSCEYEGEDMEIAFNGRFLLEMLNTLDSDDVEFSLTEHNRPGIIKPAIQNTDEEILMLCMPVVIG